MKTVLLIGQVDLNVLSEGVTQKLFSQAKAFDELGAQVDCIGYGEEGTVLCRFSNGDFVSPTVLAPARNSKLRRFDLWRGARRHAANSRYDLVYIRYPGIDPLVLETMKMLKAHGASIVMEVASFPFPSVSGLIPRLVGWADAVCNRYCRKYVDKILYVGNKTSDIFGCPSQQIPNGIPERIKALPSTGFAFDGKTIHLIAVSNMYYLHGYDRVIRGLGEYYARADRPYEILLTLVGDGPCKDSYLAEAESLHIADHIALPGVLYGDALTLAYRQATLGIGGLGLFRDGFTEGSLLKVKEYLIRGLPFVYAGTEIGLNEDFPYALQIPNDEQPVSIEAILDFVDSFFSLGPETVAAQMRSYAEEHFTWETILQNACGEYLNE